MAQRELKATVFYQAGELEYSFPFDYIRKSFINVMYIKAQDPDSIDEGVPLEYGKDYTVEDKKIKLNTVGDSAKLICLYRKTPTAPVVEFADSSILKDVDMNLDGLQQLHLNEELSDYLILHKVESGTINFIKDAADKMQEAVNTTTENVQQSIINTQSVNIRQFPNVETMKTATNLTTGLLAATQGFYTPNDGGGATYILTDTLEEGEETDGYSIIDLGETGG